MSNGLIGDKEVIKFYRARGDHGFLSNLYKHPIKFEGREFPTSEHAYQFLKFKDPEVREWAMLTPKPHLLAILAHSLFWWDMTKNWKEIKVERMLNVLRAKFSNPDLKQKLDDTKDAILIEDSKSDAFWGIGKKGKGKNMLGKLLMQVRDEIRNPFDPKFDHSKCYYWCGNPYCDSRPETQKEYEERTGGI